MREPRLAVVIVVLLFYSYTRIEPQVKIKAAFLNIQFQQPVDIENSGDGTNRIFVVEQRGVISVFPNDSNTTVRKTFLDISNKVLSGGELGMLGLAFHPDYKNNGYFFVDYTADNPRRTIISRFKVSAGDVDKADIASETIFLEVNQPYANHNGGQIAFGPDGYLYIALGDGGDGGDPQNNAQNKSVLLGKILRVDVDHPTDSTHYSIPYDNPFAGNSAGYKEEIFAYGFRNPWRFSFDRTTYRLWVADVGQDAWEEIDTVQKGGNYGWRCYEGLHSYNLTDCNGTDYISPIWEYGHNTDGGEAITGGFVYRGKIVQELIGKYIYADFISGKIWSLDVAGQNAQNNLLFSTSYSISTFGVDENDELYFADYNSGQIYKFTESSTDVVSTTVIHDFELFQNYPNPFNPTTSIEYSVPSIERVTLEVYDILGRKVSTLVNKVQQAGSYNIQLSIDHLQHASLAGRLTSGVYFYILTAGRFSATKKFVLLK